MDKMLQWTLWLGQNVTVDVVNLDVTSRQPQTVQNTQKRHHRQVDALTFWFTVIKNRLKLNLLDKNL